MAPQHIHYEVSNALRTAVNRGRVSEEDGRNALFSFFDLDLPVVSGTRSITQAWEMARQYGCSLYDGLYVALAEMTRLPLIHADRRLHNTLHGRFSYELWIEHFQNGDPDLA